MTINFHRLSVPSYFGGLPSGYDYINNAISGTPSLADGAKSGGPNAGTYFVAFGENATSSDANRPSSALAQNTDYLDNLMRRDIALPVRSSDGTGAPTASIVLTGPGVFMGLVGAVITDLFHITNTTDEDIDVAGTKIVAASAVDGGGSPVIIGGGFSSGNVTVTFNISIPSAQGFRVYYAQRTNFATFPADGLTNTRIRNLTEVDYQVEELFRLLHGGGGAWNDAWVTTIADLAHSGIMERYSRATTQTVTAPESYFPSALYDSPGAGAFFSRVGPAVTGYDLGSMYTDPANALFATKFQDTAGVTAGGTGYVAYGARNSGTTAFFTGEYLYSPGTATFLALWPHFFQSGMDTANPYTRILDGAAAQLTNPTTFNVNTGEAAVQVTAANNYWRTSSGGNSAVSLGNDLVECTWTVGPTTFRQLFVIVAHGCTGHLTDRTYVRVRNLDGTIPNFGTSPAATIRWYSTSFAVGDGGPQYHQTTWGYSSSVAIKLDGLFYQVPPFLSSHSGDDNVPRTPVSFSAQDTTSTTKALQWGGFNKADTVSAPVFPSYLRGDGGLTINGTDLDINTGNIVITVGGVSLTSGDVTASGSSNVAGALSGHYLILPVQTLSNSAGTVAVNCALGSAFTLTLSGATFTLNFTNVRAGGTYVLHGFLTGGCSVTWGGSGITHHFSSSDDAVPLGSELWVGWASNATNIYWTVTRY